MKMKNLYRTAQKFIKLLKLADEELALEPMFEGAKSKKTPTEFGDPDKRIFNPLLFELRSEIQPFRSKIKSLLQSILTIQKQFQKIVPLLQRIDYTLEKVNLGLALAQKNKTRREEILTQTYDLFLSAFAAGSQASDIIDPNLTQIIFENSSVLSESQELLQNMHRKMQTLHELSRTN
jgi:hypothetical protein